jgi:PD-(D/E)XK nuclease superfamily
MQNRTASSVIAKLLLCDVERRPKNWLQFMDSENLNRDIFQIIANDQKSVGILTQELSGEAFGSSCVTREPDRGLCDLKISDTATERKIFIEFKVWSKYRIDQIERLVQRLEGQKALAILLGRTGCENTAKMICDTSNGRIRKISYKELINVLKRIVDSQSGGAFTLELASAYAEALRGHRDRIRSELCKDPDC